MRKIQGTICFASFIGAAITSGGLEGTNPPASLYWFGIFFTATIIFLPRRQTISSRKGKTK